MRWAVGLTAGLSLALSASAALACHADYRCPPGHAYDGPNGPPPAQGMDGAPSAAANVPPPPPAAQPAPPPPPPPPLTIGQRYTLDSVFPDEGGLYMYGHRAAPCRCRAAESVHYERREYERSDISLSNGFFADAGGVGPLPSGGYYYDSGTYVIRGQGGHRHPWGLPRAVPHGGFRGR